MYTYTRTHIHTHTHMADYLMDDQALEDEIEAMDDL